MCYKSYFRDDLHFFSFLLGKKFPRAFCAGDRCYSANSDTRYPLANRQVLQTLRRWGNEALYIHLTQLKSLSELSSACTSRWKSALQRGRATPLEDYCKETWGSPGSRGELLLLFCSLVLWACFLAPTPVIWRQPEYFNTSDVSLVCLSFLFCRLRALKPLQEKTRNHTGRWEPCMGIERRLRSTFVSLWQVSVQNQSVLITPHHLLIMRDHCFSKVCSQTAEKRKLIDHRGFQPLSEGVDRPVHLWGPQLGSW